METTRDQLAEALYQKGLALADIQSLEVGASNIMVLFANVF
jgi:tripeptidyl-peptidase-2